MPDIESVQERHPGTGGEIDRGYKPPSIGAYVGSVAAVGLGVALIEGELLAGMALGVAAMAFPNLIPRFGTAFRPLLKSAVRAGYGVAARTRETVAELGEQFEDVVAEVRAEQGHAGQSNGVDASARPNGEQAPDAPSETAGETSRGRKPGKSHAAPGQTPGEGQ